MEKLFIGIDPGILGAVGAICPNCGPQVWDTPTAVLKRTKRDYLVGDMRAVLSDVCCLRGSDVQVVLERGIPMPSQSSSSTYVTGRGGGIWEGMLAGLALPYTLVQASQWKRVLSLTGQEKSGSRVRAQQLFPSIADRFSKVKDDGRAEAILLAEYGRRQG